jgi:hypothetical protein
MFSARRDEILSRYSHSTASYRDRLDRRISDILRGQEETAEVESGSLTLALTLEDQRCTTILRKVARLLRTE